MDKVRVGILGSGDVGKALARGFLGLGQQVKVGSRSPEKLSDFVSQAGAGASAGTFEETAKFGDLIALATLGSGAEEAIRIAGADNFRGKVLIDATNPLDFSSGMPPKLFVGHTDSLGERVQRAAPEAKVVKAFNTAGNAYFVNPQFPGGPPDMFIAGNDAGAKKIVGQICRDFGWGVVDLGGIEMSRHLEAMCIVWVAHCAASGKWNAAFKMLHTSE